MCGRYANRSDAAELAAWFGATDHTGGELGADFNVTPTRTVPIVVERFAAGGGTTRSIRPVRWGLVPTWAENPADGPPMINARAESITEKPAYAESVARRRCLMPATGWYEWEPRDGAGRAESGRRQPYFCGREDGAVLAMAAVFSAWWPREATHGREPLVTCAVVTTGAVGEFAGIHPRMPLVLAAEHWDAWLDPARADVADLLSGAAPAAVDELELRPVSPEVNSMRNNHPGLLRRVEPARPLALVES